MKYFIDDYKLASIDLPENFALSKVIQEQDGMKQKVDEGGNALFTKYELLPEFDFIGNPIYLDQNGGKTLDPQSVATWTFEEVEGEMVSVPSEWVDNEPSLVMTSVETTDSKIPTAWETQTVTYPSQIQKTDEQGNLLYIDGETGEETLLTGYEDYDENFIENAPVMIPIEYPEGFQLVQEVQVPTEWLEYEPVMVPNMVDVTKNFSEKPELFTVEEIITQKFTLIAQELGFEYCIADCFLTAEDLDLEWVEHKADTGVKLVSIQPNGACRTKQIQLDVPVGARKLYLEADINIVANAFIDYDVFTVVFNETQGKRGNVRAYALFFNEEVVQ